MRCSNVYICWKFKHERWLFDRLSCLNCIRCENIVISMDSIRLYSNETKLSDAVHLKRSEEMTVNWLRDKSITSSFSHLYNASSTICSKQTSDIMRCVRQRKHMHTSVVNVWMIEFWNLSLEIKFGMLTRRLRFGYVFVVITLSNTPQLSVVTWTAWLAVPWIWWMNWWCTDWTVTITEINKAKQRILIAMNFNKNRFLSLFQLKCWKETELFLVMLRFLFRFSTLICMHIGANLIRSYAIQILIIIRTIKIF